jgi:hypothetical protein
VDSDQVSAAGVELTARSVVGAARIELDAALANSTGLNLDTHELAARRRNRDEIKCESLPEGQKDCDVSGEQSSSYSCFGRISSLNRVHASTITRASDRTHVRVLWR